MKNLVCYSLKRLCLAKWYRKSPPPRGGAQCTPSATSESTAEKRAGHPVRALLEGAGEVLLLVLARFPVSSIAPESPLRQLATRASGSGSSVVPSCVVSHTVSGQSRCLICGRFADLIVSV